MPLRLDIKRRLTARSDRVKSVDLHPTEPWMVVSLYSGAVVVWNHDTQTMVKTFELCELPVRVARFVARKHWVIAGSDDMQIRVFNYNTLERVHMFEAHADYIRCIAVHPTQPYILTSSDDMLIKLWDWDRKWACTQVFEGHTHYVMQIVINPKDNNQFASASLDRTIKVWQLGSRTANFTLEGHEKGVNCIDYYSGGDKPYLISGADDCLVKIWDYQNKTCVQTLEGHAQNVTCVNFHPGLPIILTGAEDGTVRVWHSNTYRLENTLNYGMERVWCISGQRGSNSVAVGYDEGSIIIKLGREEPAMSMDASGKIMWARHSEVQQANLKAMGDAEVRDGERLALGCKDMGSCEIYPQTIQHSPNGRFVVVCGDGEYIIYTAMALRNKSFGSALEFVWAHDSSQYATREGNSMLKIFKNFKEKKSFKPDFGAEGIFGGFLLGARSSSGLAFFDWETADLVRRIEIQPKHIFWSDSGELVCIATDESFFVLRYLPDKVAAALESKEGVTEDGIEDAFEVLGEISEVVRTGLWVGDCFMYTSSVNRLNYYVGGEIITIAHMDRTMYLLGYIPKDDRLYLGDKELNVISYSLLLSVLEYQTAVMRRDFGTADKILPTIPREQRTRVANFLEKQGFKQQALAVSTDPEHKFELALHLGELDTAYQLAVEAESEQKWKQLAELATTKCQFSLAQECLDHAQDYGGLLLLATASGNAAMVGKLAEGAEKSGKTNVAFLTYFMQGRLDKCLELLIKTDRLPEAAFLARTYLPSHVPRVVGLWKESLSKVNQKAADALADPTEYGNLFPGLQQALLAEQYLKETHVGVRPAAEYPLIMPNEDRDVMEESAGFVAKEDVSKSEEVEQSVEQISTVAAAVAAAAPVLEAADETAVPEAAAEETAPPEEETEETAPLVEETEEATAVETPPLEATAVEPEPLEATAEEIAPLEATAEETAPGEDEAEETEPLEEETDEIEEAAADEIVPELAAAAAAAAAAAVSDEVIPTEAAAEEAVLPEQAAEEAVEEPIPPKQEVIDLVQTTEEESVQIAASPPPPSVAAAPEPDDTQQAEPASVPEVAEVMEASVPVEDGVLEESVADTAPLKPEMVQSTPVEDTSVLEVVQEAAAPAAINESTAEVVVATEEAQSDTAATEVAEDVPVATELTNDEDLLSTESTAAEEMPVNVELEKEVIPVTASPIKDTALAFLEEATPGPLEDVLGKGPAAVTVEELISFETTETSLLGQDKASSSEIAFDPLFDPLADTMSLLKPEAAPEPGPEGQSATKPEGNLELLVSLEPEVVPVVSKPAEEVLLNMDDEDLDDLDLDNFDLEDIDTTDVNLDDELLSE